MNDTGFSLIESLMVLLITGILLAIAYPSYQNTLVRAHRAEAKSALLDLAIQMENFYRKKHTYSHAAERVLQDLPQGQWYTVSVLTASSHDYMLVATPIGSQALNDHQCQSFTWSNEGIPGIRSGPGGVPTGNTLACW